MAVGNCPGAEVICHSSLAGGISIPWSWLAENVGAASPRTNVQGVIEGFAHSPGHAANILSPNAKYAGIGVATAGNSVFVTEEFLQP